VADLSTIGAQQPPALRVGAQQTGQFGFHREPQGSLADAIGQRVSQTVSPVIEQVKEEGFGLDYPTMDELRAAPAPTATLAEVGQEGFDRITDALTPLGTIAGTIIGRGAIHWNEAKVLQTQHLRKPKDQGGEGMSKREAAAVTGYYQDQAGNWKTQISDKTSTVTETGTNMLNRWKPSQKLNEGGRWPRTMLSSVYKHDTLYENYPWMAQNVDIKWTKETKLGAVGDVKLGSKDGKVVSAEVWINPQGIDEYAEMYGISRQEALRSVINHETNHVIQAIDELPSGSSEEFFEGLKLKLPVVKKDLKSKKETLAEIPETAPLYQELSDEVERLQKHVDFVEMNLKEKDEFLYYNTLGEADAFWSQTMRNVANPQYTLPYHEDVRSKVRMPAPEWTGDGYHDVNFSRNRMAVTSPGYETVGEVAPISPLRATPGKGGMGDIGGGPESEAAFGMKPRKLAELWHGTGSEGAKQNILDKGFIRGESAELNIPGTSVSRDPLVSSKLFAYDEIENMLKVEYTGDPSKARNLKPSEYFSGVTAETGQIYGKPQTTFHESEIYGVRGKDEIRYSDTARVRLEQKAKAAEKKALAAQKVGFNAKRDAEAAYEKYYHANEEYHRLLTTQDVPIDKLKAAQHKKKKLARVHQNKMEKYRTLRDEAHRQIGRVRTQMKAVEKGYYPKHIQPPFKAKELTEPDKMRVLQADRIQKDTKKTMQLLNDTIADFTYYAREEGQELTQKSAYQLKKMFQKVTQGLESSYSTPAYLERLLIRPSLEGWQGRNAYSFVDLMADPDSVNALEAIGIDNFAASELQFLAERVSDADRIFQQNIRRFKTVKKNQITMWEDPVADPSVVPKVADELDQSYREYKRNRDEFMKGMSRVFGGSGARRGTILEGRTLAGIL